MKKDWNWKPPGGEPKKRSPLSDRHQEARALLRKLSRNAIVAIAEGRDRRDWCLTAEATKLMRANGWYAKIPPRR